MLYVHTLLYIKKEQKQAEWKEERTRAKDAAAIFASSSPLFCSVWCLHRPHHRQPLTTSPACVSAQGEGMKATPSGSGRCHRHHIATTSPANSSHRASPRRSAILPASFNSSSILQVVREGQRASQGGPPLPAHPVYPLHPAGEDRHRPASHFWRFGEHIPQTRTNWHSARLPSVAAQSSLRIKVLRIDRTNVSL